MANYSRKSYSRNSSRTRKSYKRKSRFTTLEKDAYKLGLLKRGIENKDSRVYQSFKNGCNRVSVRKKQKPLI